MLSYIVGFIAFLIFVINPLSQIIWPSRTVHRTARPQLNESLIALDGPNQTAIDCPPDSYSVHVFSRSPLVLYIEGFLSLADREHLLNIRYLAFPPPFPFPQGASSPHVQSCFSQPSAAIRFLSLQLLPMTGNPPTETPQSGSRRSPSSPGQIP